jgi:hypothetical protein
MVSRKVIFVAVFLPFCWNQSIINSQVKKPKSQLICVLEVRVKPAGIDAFENAVRELIGQFKESEFPRSFVGDITDDYSYYFSSPIESYAEIDILFRDLDEIQNKMDAEKRQDLQVLFKDAYESIRSGVILKRPDLSYVPDNSRLSIMEARYMRMNAFYILAGREGEFENICKASAELWRRKRVPEPFNVYVGQMGTETPVYFLSLTGKDPADLWSHVGRIWTPNGSESQDLRKKILPLIRK